MKRIYLIGLMLLVCTGGFSQKVNIKKNIISLDDVNVGMVEKYDNKETKEKGYTYSDLNGTNKVTMIRYYLGENKTFFALRPNFVKDTAEIKLEFLYFTLNEQSGLTDLLIKKYNFFDKNGMNINAIKDYVSTPRESLISLAKQQIQERKQSEQMQKQSEEQQKQNVRSMGIIVNRNGEIISGPNIMGYFVPLPNPNLDISPDNRIVIKDEAGNVIAAVTAGSGAINGFQATVLTYDNNTFKCDVRRAYDKGNPVLFYNEIANFLALKEYLKGQSNSYVIKKAEFDQIQKAQAQEQQQRNQERAADIAERTTVAGILTLKDGTKIPSTFRFNYRQTDEGKVAPEGSITDLDAGKIIFYLYKDEKGKDKIKKYSVKDVDTFFINDEEVYESVTYKGNLLKDAMAKGSLDVGKLMGGNKTQKFLLRLAVTDKARLYYYDGEYILMKPGSEDAIVGKTLKAADLVKFTSDCPAISQKIADKSYNTEENSYKQLVEEYTKCN